MNFEYSFHHISEDMYLGDIEQDSLLIIKTQQLNDKVECQQTRKIMMMKLTITENC